MKICPGRWGLLRYAAHPVGDTATPRWSGRTPYAQEGCTLALLHLLEEA